MTQLPAVPPLPAGLLTHAEHLIAHYDGLTTFEHVSEWDTAAEQVASALQSQVAELERYLQWLSTELAREANEHGSKPWYVRLFASRPYRVHVMRVDTATREVIRRLSSVADDLDDRIASTPDDADQLADMIDQLKHFKKELQLELREVKAGMRDARAHARSRRAGIPTGGRGFLATMNRHERFRVRLQLESRLQSGESEMHALERQMGSLDRKLHWLERFKLTAKRGSRRSAR